MSRLDQAGSAELVAAAADFSDHVRLTGLIASLRGLLAASPSEIG